MRYRTIWSLTTLVCAMACFSAVSSVKADECQNRTLLDTPYVVCAFNPAKDDLRLYWRGQDGRALRTFDRLAGELKGEGRELVFAMNGGMYEHDFSPVGLHVEQGQMLSALNTKTVTGSPSQIPNFFKKPNGVFFWGQGRAGVLESGSFAAQKPRAAYATQSGPMLVVEGEIHPAFIENSRDLKPRNGVGVASDGTVYFVMTRGRVSFYQFARAFRDGLGVQNALFLDGGWAPGIYAPELRRNDRPGHGGYGPIIAVVR